MGILKTCDEIITLQRSISYTRKNMEKARKMLRDQITNEEEPTYIGKIYESKTFIIGQSSKIMEFLGFSELSILRKKRDEYKSLRDEYYTVGRGYSKKSLENARIGGDCIGIDYHYEEPLQGDCIGVDFAPVRTGGYCEKLSMAYLECADKSKVELDYFKTEIAKRKNKKR